jgi:hypothetical protein
MGLFSPEDLNASLPVGLLSFVETAGTGVVAARATAPNHNPSDTRSHHRLGTPQVEFRLLLPVPSLSMGFGYSKF